VRRLHADMLQTVWNEIDFRVDVCRITNVVLLFCNGACLINNIKKKKKGCTYRAPVRYVAKTWSVVLLNKKIHILPSQVYCA